MTEKQIFDCLTSDVNTESKLIAKMHSLYPALINAIDSTFNTYGTTIIIPGTGNITFHNQTINSYTVISGDTISVQNVTVTNNAQLTLKASRIVINNSFTVNNGSQFVLTTDP